VRLFSLQKLFNSGREQRSLRRLSGKVFTLIELRALLGLLSHTNGFNDPIGEEVSTLIQGFSLGSLNIHGPSMGDYRKRSKHNR
jgi:hypothetical protein